MGRIYAATETQDDFSRSSKSFLDENSAVLEHLSDLSEMQSDDLAGLTQTITKLAQLSAQAVAGKANIRLGNFANADQLNRAMDNILIKVRNQANALSKKEMATSTVGGQALVNTLMNRLDDIKDNVDEVLEDKLASMLKTVVLKTAANSDNNSNAEILEQLREISNGRTTEMLSGEESTEKLESLLENLHSKVIDQDKESSKQIEEILSTIRNPEEGPNKELGDFIKELRSAETLTGKSLDEIISQIAGDKDSPLLPEMKEVLDKIQAKGEDEDDWRDDLDDEISEIKQTSKDSATNLGEFKDAQEERDILDTYRTQKLIQKVEELTNNVNDLTDAIRVNGSDVLENLTNLRESSSECGCPVDSNSDSDLPDRDRKKKKRPNKKKGRGGRGRGGRGGGRAGGRAGGAGSAGTRATVGRVLGASARFAVTRALPVAAAGAGGWYVGTKIHERFGDQIQKGVEFVFGDPMENAQKKMDKERRGRIYQNQDIIPQEIKKKGSDPTIAYIREVLIPETQAQTDISAQAKTERLRKLSQLRQDLYQEYKETDYVKEVSDLKIRMKAMDEKKVPTLEELQKTYRGITEEAYTKIIGSLPTDLQRPETDKKEKKKEAPESKSNASAKVPSVPSTDADSKESKQAEGLKETDTNNSFRSMINSAMFSSPLLRGLTSRMFMLPNAISESFGTKHTPQTEQFSKVLESYGSTRQFIRADGSIETRKDGSRAWRNNNPGNLRYGKFAENNGAIGKDSGGFAIFPSREAGEAAQINLIKKNYSKLTLRQMIYKYAPPSENDTENYLAQVVMRTGIGPNDVIGSLDSSRFKALIKQVQKHEGWIEGTVKVDKSSSSQSAFIPYKDAGTATQGGKFGGAGASGSWSAPQSAVGNNAGAVPSRANTSKDLNSSDIKVPSGGGSTQYKDLKVKSGESIGGGSAHQGVLELAKIIQGNFGVRHFSAFNDRYHQTKRPNSLHTKGLALDFSLKDPKTASTVTSKLSGLLKNAGVSAKVLNEYANPSAGATGGHIHVQFQSKKDAETFLTQVKNTNHNTKKSEGIPKSIKRPEAQNTANSKVPVKSSTQKAEPTIASTRTPNKKQEAAPAKKPESFEKGLADIKKTLGEMKASNKGAHVTAQSTSQQSGFWPNQTSRDSAIRDMQDAKFTSGSGLLDA